MSVKFGVPKNQNVYWYDYHRKKIIPSFAMDTAHNFGPEFRSEKPVRVLHENKISRIFFPHPANVLITSFDDKHTGYIDSMFSCFGKNLKTGGIILILISSTVCLKY